jgi:sugar-specific transcriptional regulator TrmB
MSINTAPLEKVGLTKKQAELYILLLKIGPSSVGTMVKEMDIARISCYDVLNRLQSKGLVSDVQFQGKRLYAAVDPHILLKKLQDKQQIADEEVKMMRKILPELESLVRHKTVDQDAAVYKTREGIKSVFELMIRERKLIRVIGATGKAMRDLKHYFPQWHRRRKELHIPVKVLYNVEGRAQTKKIPLADVRMMPKGFDTPATVFIFGNYVATLYYGDMPFAFLMHSREIAESYEQYFRVFWEYKEIKKI